MAELRVRLETALRGRYTVDREVGRGGMAIVYLAHDLQLERDVALKVLRPELAVTLGPDRFLQEIRLAAGLAHPHILPLHDSGEADGLLFYVMPFVRGESLRDRLEREHTLPMAEALRLAREVADALDYAHRAGVVHRDIKPENVLLQEDFAVVADFGIARAISAAGAKRMTTAGMAVGTREYMSPEQAAGSRAVDGRSDIYSLGCMLFEMLTGNPPAVGTPPEGTIVGSRRVADRAAELTALRPSVPAEVAGIVARMLSAEPGERFQTAAELADALAAPTGVWTPRSVAAERRRRWGAGVAAVMVLGAAAIFLRPWDLRGAAGSLIVGPCVTDPGGPRGMVNRGQCDRHLQALLGHWTDVRVGSSPRLQFDALRPESPGLSLEEALDSASADHLELLPWLSITSLNDSQFELRLDLWDVVQHQTVMQSRITVIPNREQLDAKLDTLMERMARDGAVGSSPGAASHTRLLAAFLAFDSARAEMAGWNLAAAEAGFHRAIALDSTYPEANLWLAQVLAWRQVARNDWAQFAMRALQRQSELSPTEQALGRAMVALAERRFPDACEEYEHLVRRDSLDFAAWYGLGDCLTDDHAVVADSTSPSHWSFRTSVEAALRAYRTAFRLNPFANRAFADRFTDFSFLLEEDGFRSGVAIPPDTGGFGGRVTMQGDTLAVIAYRLPDALSRPASKTAVTRVREVLREIALRWVHAAPRDPEARAHLSLVLETQGQLPESPEIDATALGSLLEARRLAHDSALALRLAVDEVRLRLKLQEWAAAFHLADSILAADRDPAPETSALLGPVAMLTGRASLAAELLGRSLPVDTVMLANGAVTTLPGAPEVHRIALRLSAFAGVGAPAESISVLEGRVDSLMALTVPPSEQRAVEAQIVFRSVELGFPVVGGSSVHLRPPAEGQPTWMLRRQQEYAAGNTVAVRRAFLQHSPAIVSMDGTFLQAWLLAAVGDTGRAIAWLDGSLTRMSRLRIDLLDRRQAGGLVRAMALRAELAAAVGDRPTAQYWGNAVATLWADADSSLRPLVARMRSLSGRQ